MSKRISRFTTVVAIGAALAAAPSTVFAGHHGHHGSSHYSHHGGSHYSRHFYGGGWGGSRFVYFGFGAPSFYYGDPFYYADPYYYAPPPPACDWEQVRVWSRGHWVWRNVQRCY